MQPRGMYQTSVLSIGLFIGCIINGYIFGELALIFSSLGKSEKAFQSLMASVNTAMIHLKLPFEN